MRHNPPFVSRPWVVTAAGRRARLGTAVACPPCDRAELPADLVLLRTAGPFESGTLPAGLRRPHRTAPGTWARLRVLSGLVRVDVQVHPPLAAELAGGDTQALPPGVWHELTLAGPARLELEFWGRPNSSRPAG
jgi:tellurite resistance-related uncharacterized protein